MLFSSDNNYDNLVTIARAFGCIGPVFYDAPVSGGFRIRVIMNGGDNAVFGTFSSEPESFSEDFLAAVSATIDYVSV